MFTKNCCVSCVYIAKNHKRFQMKLSYTYNIIESSIFWQGISGRREQLRWEIVRSCAQRFNFFTNRILKIWNKLSHETVEASGFKSRFDRTNMDNKKAFNICFVWIKPYLWPNYYYYHYLNFLIRLYFLFIKYMII